MELMKIFRLILVFVFLASFAAAGLAVTAQQEKEMGEEFVKKIKQHLTLVSDPIVNAYIDSLATRLVKSGRAPNRKYAFFVVESKSINAFAAPDGYIGITTGLIQAARNESEFASVIAHEIAHISQRHLSRMMAESKTQMLTSLAACWLPRR